MASSTQNPTVSPGRDDHSELASALWSSSYVSAEPWALREVFLKSIGHVIVFSLRARGWQGKLTELYTALLAVVIALANTSDLNLDYTLQSLKEALKYTDFHPRDSDLMGLGNDLSIWIFKGYIGDSMCILRPTS